MTNRIKNLPLFVFLVGGLFFSAGYNFYQAQRIKDLENTIASNGFLDPFNYEKIKEEITRLENVKYE
jgi:hypothetical protein